jgi:hypothetical protein
MEGNSGQMDPRTQPSNREHPYVLYEGTQHWELLSGAIEDLVKNSDLIVRTDRAYIVGYLCKILAESAKCAGPSESLTGAPRSE